MTFFFTDADLAGAGEFVEGTVSLAAEFTVPAGTINAIRARFPAVAGSTPLPRVYTAGGTNLFAAVTAFDTTMADAWNSATPVAPIAVGASTIRVTQVVTRYIAVSGLLASPITRNGVTANRSLFDGGDVAPSQASTAWYGLDIDFTAAGGGTTIALPVALDTSSALTLGRVKSRALPAAAEADTSVAIVGRKARLMPVALEVDMAMSLGGLVSGSSGPRFTQSTTRGRAVQSTPRGRSTQ
jgi:hypothetical protein